MNRVALAFLLAAVCCSANNLCPPRWDETGRRFWKSDWVTHEYTAHDGGALWWKLPAGSTTCPDYDNENQVTENCTQRVLASRVQVQFLPGRGMMFFPDGAVAGPGQGQHYFEAFVKIDFFQLGNKPWHKSMMIEYILNGDTYCWDPIVYMWDRDDGPPDTAKDFICLYKKKDFMDMSTLPFWEHLSEIIYDPDFNRYTNTLYGYPFLPIMQMANFNEWTTPFTLVPYSDRHSPRSIWQGDGVSYPDAWNLPRKDEQEVRHYTTDQTGSTHIHASRFNAVYSPTAVNELNQSNYNMLDYHVHVQTKPHPNFHGQYTQPTYARYFPPPDSVGRVPVIADSQYHMNNMPKSDRQTIYLHSEQEGPNFGKPMPSLTIQRTFHTYIEDISWDCEVPWNRAVIMWDTNNGSMNGHFLDLCGGDVDHLATSASRYLFQPPIPITPPRNFEGVMNVTEFMELREQNKKDIRDRLQKFEETGEYDLRRVNIFNPKLSDK